MNNNVSSFSQSGQWIRTHFCLFEVRGHVTSLTVGRSVGLVSGSVSCCFLSDETQDLNHATCKQWNLSETELTSDMTLHWSDGDEDATVPRTRVLTPRRVLQCLFVSSSSSPSSVRPPQPVGSPSPVFPEEERPPPPQAERPATSQNHVTTTTTTNCR